MTLAFTNFNNNIQSQKQLLTTSVNVNNDIPGVLPFDIYLDNDGNLAMSNNQQAVLEACAEAANTLLGEVVLNTNIGIPYFQVVWIGVPNIQQLQSSLKNAFINVGGGGYVSGVPSLITNYKDNILTYSAIIQTIYGILRFSNSVTGNVNA